MKLKQRSLEWSLKHIEKKHGDTDIFPIPFEYEAIRHSWDSKKKNYMCNIEIDKWTVRPYRKSLTPKHRYGFRVATQLDPLDCILFTGLVYEIGNDIESSRLSANKKKVAFSHRFKPENDGGMYDPNIGWKQFQERSEEILAELNNPFDDEYESYVIVADIADFYPRLYSHPLENALKHCTPKKIIM